MREQCPQCRATFSSVIDLIAHVDQVHPGARPMDGAEGGNEACPYCAQIIHDPIQLLRHVESHRFEFSQQASKSEKKSECVLS